METLLCNNLVVNTFGNTFYKVIVEHEKSTVFKTNIILPNQNESETDLNSRFICSINPFNRHLLFNPYELSCGNILCFICIYDHYNLLTNEFKCPFKTCKTHSHLLKNELVPLKLIEMLTIFLLIKLNILNV